MAYTAEMLAALSDMDLDDMIEELVMDKEPEPGLLQRIKRGAVRRLGRNGSDGEFPAYKQQSCGDGPRNGGYAGQGLYGGRRAPVAWCGWRGAGREIKYVGGIAMPRAVAIAAVLAVQEAPGT